jgi:hypothetical protein
MKFIIIKIDYSKNLAARYIEITPKIHRYTGFNNLDLHKPYIV